MIGAKEMYEGWEIAGCSSEEEYNQQEQDIREYEFYYNVNEIYDESLEN